MRSLISLCFRKNQTEGVYREARVLISCSEAVSDGWAKSQMYDDAMTAIHNHLIQKSITGNFIYTAELIPERDRPGGEV
jgi:hypothetical protein